MYIRQLVEIEIFFYRFHRLNSIISKLPDSLLVDLSFLKEVTCC